MAVELSATPFFPQTAYQCGPAALATVLGAAGVDGSPDTLAQQVYIPGRRGSLQVELVAATRRADRVPWLIAGDLPTLAGELAAGHPVLVLQDLGRFGLRQWHYAVVIGIDPATDTLLLRSGRKARLSMDASRFLHSWQPGGQWALVVLAPGALPATATPDLVKATLAEAEGLLPPESLAATWAAAVARWPGDPGLGFAAANAALATGDEAAAEAGYRRVLAHEPDYLPALNNLADLLLARDCSAEGQQLAARAAVAAGQPGVPEPWRQAIADTVSQATACSTP
jgi:hypothetical protein